MGELQIGTIALLGLWTVWTMLALVLMDRYKWLLAVFIPLAILLAIKSDVTWRAYIMAWLGAHASVSVLSAEEGYRAKQIALAMVSLGGVGWLWGADDWLNAGPVITGSVIAVGAATVALSWRRVWKFRKEHGRWPLPRRARTVPADGHVDVFGDGPVRATVPGRARWRRPGRPRRGSRIPCLLSSPSRPGTLNLPSPFRLDPWRGELGRRRPVPGMRGWQGVHGVRRP